MREVYRLNKHLLVELIEKNGLQIHLAFNYVSNDESDFAAMDKKMKMALQKLAEKVENSSKTSLKSE
jgi:imidazoleglycerol phosphate dehydratase HisB